MDKKKYIKPLQQVVKLNTNQYLLTTSVPMYIEDATGDAMAPELGLPDLPGMSGLPGLPGLTELPD